MDEALQPTIGSDDEGRPVYQNPEVKFVPWIAFWRDKTRGRPKLHAYYVYPFTKLGVPQRAESLIDKEEGSIAIHRQIDISSYMYDWLGAIGELEELRSDESLLPTLTPVQ